MITIYICTFFLGASISSFLNATLYRVENNFNKKEFLTKPSHCEKCKKQLNWYELIPVLGYILQLGKCSKCKTAINMYYPISELTMGIAAVLFFMYPIPWYLILIFILLSVLSYYDQKDNSVPRYLVHILVTFCLVIFMIYSREYINLLLPSTIFIVFFVINIFKKSFGFGDMLIFLGVGLLLSYQKFVIFFWTSILVALLYSFVMVIVEKKKIKNTKIPMVPFLTIGYLVATIYGEEIFKYLWENIIL
jgi:prepilin signal peptidase PulO-like enzyme (type II secretory pathway)